MPGRSGVGWEVMAPRGDDSFLHRFLAGAQGPGLHHVAFQVDDLDAAMAELRTQGIEPFGTETAEEHNDRAVTYLHPRRGGIRPLGGAVTGSGYTLSGSRIDGFGTACDGAGLCVTGGIVSVDLGDGG